MDPPRLPVGREGLVMASFHEQWMKATNRVQLSSALNEHERDALLAALDRANYLWEHPEPGRREPLSIVRGVSQLLLAVENPGVL